MARLGKVSMWLKRLVELITFGHSKGWWKEKPKVPGLDKKVG